MFLNLKKNDSLYHIKSLKSDIHLIRSQGFVLLFFGFDHFWDNVSYGCEEDIEDIKRWISEEGEDAQVALYYAQHDGAYVFHDFDIYVEGMDFTYDNYLITTLKKALAVLELQDEMFDNVTNW